MPQPCIMIVGFHPIDVLLLCSNVRSSFEQALSECGEQL